MTTFKNGHIYVAMDVPAYGPGEKVTGKINFSTTKVLDADHIDICIMGVEYSRF